MKNIYILVLLISCQFAMAQVQLSDKAEMSVLTLGPSQDELYTAFGHSAIRVYDPELGIDYAFNYGLFSFDQPHFYLNFARGSSFYILGVEAYPDFEYAYRYYNRFIHEQKLNLTSEQRQKVYEFLLWNARKENRSYRYDYFYDNCATRVRDVFANVLKGEVKFDSTYIKTNYSIRNLTDIYLSQQPWGDLGIDICLGLPMDKKISPYQYMFLPDYIESSFDHATINGQPLVTNKISTFEPEAQEVTGPPHPLIVFGIFLLITIGISVLDWQRGKVSKWFDVPFFTVLGLLGILLILLWTATDHRAAANNFNILWALPTHLIVWGLLKRNPSNFVRKYFLIVAGISAVLLLVWFILPQQLNLFLIPVVASILIRSFIIQKILSRQSV